MPVPASLASPALARQQLSTRLVFLNAGLGIAAWAPLVPFAQARGNLDAGDLGLLLLCIGAGSIVTMPLAGVAAARFGCRAVLIAATVLMCLMLPLLAVLASPVLLAAALVSFGAAVGAVDCVANIQAVIVERASRRPMMSGFHGLFSLGGIVGAGGMSGLLSLGLSPLAATACMAVLILAALLLAAPHLLATGGNGGTALALPHGVVLTIAILCFILFLTEGAMLDWSAVFLTTLRGVEPAQAGLGYAAFAATMTAGRLGGDVVVQRLGGTRVVVLGSLCAAAGLALATVVPVWEAALAGYALVGAGCSNVVPVLYSALGRQTAMPESAAVPAVTTLGYAGILAGPVLIGWGAQATSLPIAFIAVALLLIGVAASARLLFPPSRA
ncbi:MAG TPA: MFS transporter [Vineibacter sp.]|nr:MFS transporter [Vineibacter sp.]